MLIFKTKSNIVKFNNIVKCFVDRQIFTLFYQLFYCNQHLRIIICSSVINFKIYLDFLSILNFRSILMQSLILQISRQYSPLTKNAYIISVSQDLYFTCFFFFFLIENFQISFERKTMFHNIQHLFSLKLSIVT